MMHPLPSPDIKRTSTLRGSGEISQVLLVSTFQIKNGHGSLLKVSPFLALLPCSSLSLLLLLGLLLLFTPPHQKLTRAQTQRVFNMFNMLLEAIVNVRSVAATSPKLLPFRSMKCQSHVRFLRAQLLVQVQLALIYLLRSMQGHYAQKEAGTLLFVTTSVCNCSGLFWTVCWNA
jgi:hypothetical protein